MTLTLLCVAQPISHADFLKYAEGNGWKHVSTYEIDENGRVMKKGYYEGLEGASSSDYYFEKDSYSYNYFSFPYGIVYSTTSYIYQEDGNRIGYTNRFDDSFFTRFQVLSIDEHELQVVEYLGFRSGENSRDIFGLVTYQKMTDEERESYLHGYNNYKAVELDASFMFKKFGDITEEDFLQEVVGYGWQWDKGGRIITKSVRTEHQHQENERGKGKAAKPRLFPKLFAQGTLFAQLADAPHGKNTDANDGKRGGGHAKRGQSPVKQSAPVKFGEYREELSEGHGHVHIAIQHANECH